MAINEELTYFNYRGDFVEMIWVDIFYLFIQLKDNTLK